MAESIQSLLSQFIDLHEQQGQNHEDYSLSEEIGDETDSEFQKVRNEIIRRASLDEREIEQKTIRKIQGHVEKNCIEVEEVEEYLYQLHDKGTIFE